MPLKDLEKRGGALSASLAAHDAFSVSFSSSLWVPGAPGMGIYQRCSAARGGVSTILSFLGDLSPPKAPEGNPSG